MPQPEQITLEVRIDALGIHFYSLRKTDEALRRLIEQLPSGAQGPTDADFDAVLAASPKTALVTVTHWRDSGARESTDLVLAAKGQHLHVFLRNADDPAQFTAQPLGDGGARALIERLIAQPT